MNLSIKQKKAISHVKGPALVLAVPGAGKTTVLIHRTANLILNNNISPEKILSITFSKASAKDMKNRFNSIYGDISQVPVHFSTIHSFTYSLIREYAFNRGIAYTFIENNDKRLNKSNLLKELYLSLNKNHITEEKFDSLVSSISYIKNMLISPEEFLSRFKTNINNFEAIFDAYEDYKKSNKLIDFDDMLTLSLEILRKDIYLLNKYRHRYQYIQVDEGQDTSKVQLEIIKNLSFPNNNLFIVADDDQSIYGFRGAYPQGLFEFNKIYKNNKIFYMEENYRSSKNIVSISNKFIKKNILRYNKDIFTKNPYVSPVDLVKVENIKEEYQYIMKHLRGIKDLNGTAILFRNNISAIGLIDSLEDNSIPFIMKDTNIKFFNHWIIQDIISFFLLSYDNTDMESFQKIYYKMDGFISKNQVNSIRLLSPNSSVFDRLLNIPGINKFYNKNFLNLKLNFKKLSKMKPSQGILHINEKLGYENYLKESCMKFGYNMVTLKTILKYLKIIADKTIDFRGFISRLDYLKYLCTESKNTNNGITLSTIHSAKGLEFNSVYIIDLVEGDFPNTACIDALNKGNIEALEEERRLFYVGMTRAKKHLILITYNHKSNEEANPSRFLLELEELTD